MKSSFGAKSLTVTESAVTSATSSSPRRECSLKPRTRASCALSMMRSGKIRPIYHLIRPRQLRATKLRCSQQGFKTWFCVMKVPARVLDHDRAPEDRDHGTVLESVDQSGKRLTPSAGFAAETM